MLKEHGTLRLRVWQALLFHFPVQLNYDFPHHGQFTCHTNYDCNKYNVGINSCG